MKDRLIIALDLSDEDRLNQVLKDLRGSIDWVKVGMEIFYRFGPAIVQRIKDHGYRIFLDLKMHDIPNTVERAARNLTRLGVDMFNVHTAGGAAMMGRAAVAARETAAELGLTPPIVIGVTVLTSISPAIWQNEVKGALPLPDQVMHFSALAKNAGLAGVVCSPEEIIDVKNRCGQDFLTVVPGIRPTWAETGDQKRITTPKQAILNGADYLVIGRPVLAAPDPKAAVARILEEIKEG
ncbi:MAG TPA: orotidine-5'-phosphate decarboxylase [Bacillota bacterium]|jgi:orotidine-5'-phosphate decarboxylase|nr:orotidine-5'-phosphate decarboxylase [Bacillota bacterium]HPT67517.1 orotidine-5'-phosphate decarboxylase [Bacillota bacterium]